jgi:hypothetical protein
MSSDSEQQYCVVDHANKLADRDRVNPNRAVRRQGVRHRADASEDRADGAPLSAAQPGTGQ